MAGLVLCGPAGAAPAEDALAEATIAIEKGDGIAAEIAARRALEDGATRAEVAAFVGESELLQGNLADAREWLGPGQFAPGTRARGIHALARLEVQEDNPEAAEAAFERLIEIGPAEAGIWVDFGRLRYRMGEHHGALAAAREAVRLGPGDPRALEFMAQLTRDAQGPAAAVPLFRAAADASPLDCGLWGQYAATLAEAGRHSEMLAVARRMVEIDPRDPQAYFLQAVLAARVGRDDLARKLLWRTNGAFSEQPAGMLLSGIIEFRSGNHGLAADHFAALLRRQPMNITIVHLFARALVAHGDANVAIDLLEPLAARRDAPRYLLVLLGRAYEQAGQRERAAIWLDRAANQRPTADAALLAFDSGQAGWIDRPATGEVLRLRDMMGTGRKSEALIEARDLASRFPESVDYALLAGDAELLAGNAEEALRQYRTIIPVRNNRALMRRMVSALQMLDRDMDAANVVRSHLARYGGDGEAMRLLAGMEQEAGRSERAGRLLLQASRIGSGPQDPMLLTRLAVTGERGGGKGAGRPRRFAAGGL